MSHNYIYDADLDEGLMHPSVLAGSSSGSGDAAASAAPGASASGVVSPQHWQHDHPHKLAALLMSHESANLAAAVFVACFAWALLSAVVGRLAAAARRGGWARARFMRWRHDPEQRGLEASSSGGDDDDGGDGGGSGSAFGTPVSPPPQPPPRRWLREEEADAVAAAAAVPLPGDAPDYGTPAKPSPAAALGLPPRSPPRRPAARSRAQAPLQFFSHQGDDGGGSATAEKRRFGGGAGGGGGSFAFRAPGAAADDDASARTPSLGGLRQRAAHQQQQQQHQPSPPIRGAGHSWDAALLARCAADAAARGIASVEALQRSPEYRAFARGRGLGRDVADAHRLKVYRALRRADPEAFAALLSRGDIAVGAGGWGVKAGLC